MPSDKIPVMVLLSLCASSMAPAAALAPVGDVGPGEEFADRTGTQWRPFLEWRIENPTWTGNPFDLEARALFRHGESGEERATPMFFDGEGGWRFRFTGTRTGEWTFSTSSPDGDLDGKRGRVRILPNPEPRTHGFVTHFGQKWGWEGTDRAFVPQLLMYSGDPATLGDPDAIDRDVRVFFEEHGFNGFHVPTLAGRWFDAESTDLRVHDSMSDPDPRTFEALERLITRVHAAGGLVHIWVWGDHQRRQTSLSLRGGPDGQVARRLERTVAARLGPLPGWSMGYGFDLQEWAAIPGRVQLVRPWCERLEKLLGWWHPLGGRMGPTITDSTDHRVQAKLNEGLGYFSYEHHRPTYAMYRAALAALPGRPVMSEDRFRIRVPPLYPDKDYDELRTRRGLYHSTLAGGVANIWGNNHPGGWAPGGASRPYPHPEWIKTYATFFEDRFTRDMVPDETISDGLALRRPTRRHLVVYREDARSIDLDLSAMEGPQQAIAVDCQLPYRELPIGTLAPGKHSWKAPGRSDWIIAVGDFGEARSTPRR